MVLLSQRQRMLDAIVDAVAEKGYAAATVADVTRRAGVSRTTFYEHFSDKQDCYLAAYRDGGDVHYAYVRQSIDRTKDPVQRLHDALDAYLGVLASQPAFARAFLAEVRAAGPRALALHDQLHERYVNLLRLVHAELRERESTLPDLPDEVLRAVTGAIDSLIVRRLQENPSADVTALAPAARYLLLTTLGLTAKAREALRV